jgi:hypothetical protein
LTRLVSHLGVGLDAAVHLVRQRRQIDDLLQSEHKIGHTTIQTEIENLDASEPPF